MTRKKTKKNNPKSSHASRPTSRNARAVPKTKAPATTPSAPQITTGYPQGLMTPWFQDYVFRKVSGDFYEVLREGIPIIDAAIGRLIALNGTIKIIGDNTALVKELEDFCLNVPVNDMQKGIHAFMQNASNETFEQGFSISEFIATKDRKDIDRLQVADSKRIFFRRNAEGRAEPWYRTGIPVLSNYTAPGDIIQNIINTRYGQTVAYNGVEDTRLSPDNKLYFSINNENSDPYGVSILRSLEFVSQILVTAQNSIKNVTERFGDPMYHLHYSAGKEKVQDLETRRKTIEKDFNSIVTAKRQGKSGDLVTAGGPESSVTVKVIGHDGQILTYDIPLKHMLEQIVSKLNLPAWLLGLYWSTTERMASIEIEAALADAKIRQFAMLPEYIRLFSNLLRLRGRTWNSVTISADKPGDWGIVFESPNVRDMVSQAQARFLNAQADQMGSAAGTLPVKSAKEKGKCACGDLHGEKELQRPTPWPELDKIEGEYETTLKERWAELQGKVIMVLGLQGKGAKDSFDEPFSFTTEQRAQIMQAYKNWIGTFDITDDNSPVKWYYGQAYSLGLIQAVKLIGKDRPILDIIKNKEIYDKLCADGFQLVKDNATQAIIKNILPEMEAQMLVGANPVSVAEKLQKLFGDQNSDWERLARTEMSSAAEQAKLDEWGEWGMKKTEFFPAPDACPLCFSLAGEYPIDQCPIPGTGTHPRCRCSIRPAAGER